MLPSLHRVWNERSTAVERSLMDHDCGHGGHFRVYKLPGRTLAENRKANWDMPPESMSIISCGRPRRPDATRHSLKSWKTPSWRHGAQLPAHSGRQHGDDSGSTRAGDPDGRGR